MGKKDFILNLLTILEKEWAKAASLKIMLQYNKLDAGMIDRLYSIFVSSIKEVKNITMKSKLNEGIEFLKQISHNESTDRKQESKELDYLLKNI